MPITAKILADSVAPCGKRLTTFECTYPRAVHSEIMTHRMLSRNSASSRAIPTTKLIQRVLDDPWIPAHIGSNQKGMQAGTELSENVRQRAVDHWLMARDQAVSQAKVLEVLGVHKQIVNRIIEPWMWITVIISATEWDNFFGLRRHKDAEPHFHELADKMWEMQEASKPRELEKDEWHLPLIFPEDRAALWDIASNSNQPTDYCLREHDRLLVKVSVGRVARVSYLTHDGRRDHAEDIKLHDRLMVQVPLHASPAEHVAQALTERTRVGNFVGFRQYRKTLPNEHIGGSMP